MKQCGRSFAADSRSYYCFSHPRHRLTPIIPSTLVLTFASLREIFLVLGNAHQSQGADCLNTAPKAATGSALGMNSWAM